LSPGHFLTGEPLTQLSSTDYTNVNAIAFPGGSDTNSNYSSSGIDGQLTPCGACNHANDGNSHPLTSNPGDLILLGEDNMTPLQWPTNVIMDTYPTKMAPSM
jgi:hypothetical protein